MGIWQVSPGDPSRSKEVGTIFLKYGLIAVGGDDWEEEVSKNLSKYLSWASVKLCERVNIGDTLLLRAWGGRNALWAIGKVTGGFVYMKQLEDVDGWNLAATRTVDWYIQVESDFGNTDYDISKVRQFEVGQLTLDRRTLVPGAPPNIIELAQAVLEGKETNWKLCSPTKLPEKTFELSEREMRSKLISVGLKVDNVDELMRLFSRMKDLHNFYWEHQKRRGWPSEHEVIAYLVIPFLKALGWSEQQVAIEWNKVDIAIFGRNERKEIIYESSFLSILFEAKRAWGGLGWAEDQLTNYGNRYPNCNVIVATDGLRYKVFERHSGAGWRLIAYLNVFSPRDRHPYEEGVGGTIDVVRRLLP